MNGRGRPPRSRGPPLGQPPYGRGGYNQGPPMQQNGQYGQQGYGGGGYNPGQQNYGGAYQQGQPGYSPGPPQGQPGYSPGPPQGQPGYNQGPPGYNQGQPQGPPEYNQGQPGYNQGPPGNSQGQESYGGWFSSYRGNGGGPMAYDSSHGMQTWNGQPGGPGQPPNGGVSSPQGASPEDVPPDGTATTDEEKKGEPSPAASQASVEADPVEPAVVEPKRCHCDCRGCGEWDCNQRTKRSLMGLGIVMAVLFICTLFAIIFSFVPTSNDERKRDSRHDQDKTKQDEDEDDI